MDNATSPELTSPVWRIAAYDFDAGCDFVALEVGSADELPLEADLSGDGVLVIFNSRVALYAIDGSNERTLYRAPDLGYITGGAASPDGLLVALSVQREDPCLTAYAAQGGSCRPFTDFMFVTVLDRDGNELLNIEQADPRFDDFHGYFAPIVWRNDGEGFMVHGYTGSEAPGGNATILLDGGVVVSSFRIYGIYVAPNGRYLFADDWVGCNLSLNTERHALRIVDALSEDVLAEVHEPSRNIAPLEWSPDGEELLYRTADVVPGDDGCPAEDMETATWHILRASGGDPAEIPGVMDARRAWYGERLIEFECLGQPTEYSGCVVGGAYGEIQVSNRGRAITSAIEYQTIGYLPATRAE